MFPTGWSAAQRVRDLRATSLEAPDGASSSVVLFGVLGVLRRRRLPRLLLDLRVRLFAHGLLMHGLLSDGLLMNCGFSRRLRMGLLSDGLALRRNEDFALSRP